MSIIKNTEELNNLLDTVQKLPVKKDEQSKTIDITENGTTVITPDEGMTLGGVTVNTAIESGGSGTEEIENLIDQSGVLESTDGTVEDKVEQLIDKAEAERFLSENSNSFNFSGRKNFTETPILDCSGLTSLVSAFQQTNVTKIYLKNTQNVADWRYAFINASYLETLETLDFSSVKQLSNWISSDYLTNIKFVSNTIKVSMNLGWCKKLTAESKQSIIDGLATVETAQTLTLHADAKILQSQVDSANAKGWTVAGGTVVSEEEYYG